MKNDYIVLLVYPALGIIGYGIYLIYPPGMWIYSGVIFIWLLSLYNKVCK